MSRRVSVLIECNRCRIEAGRHVDDVDEDKVVAEFLDQLADLGWHHDGSNDRDVCPDCLDEIAPAKREAPLP